MKNKKLGLVIFAIALALGLNITGISPILGLVQEMNPEIPISRIQSLQSVTFGGLIVGSILFGFISEKTGDKLITIVGLIIIAICGLVPMIADGFNILFTSRIIIGFGFGFIMPINLTIIAKHFEKSERSNYMGLHVVGMGIGSMIGNLIGGLLAGINYNLFYLVYAIPIISIILVILFLPKYEKPMNIPKETNEGKISYTAYILGIIYFAEMIFITCYSMNIGMYINGYFENSASITGIMTGVNALCALLVGIYFGKITNFFKENTLTFAILSSAIGFFCLIIFKSTVGILICSGLCGVSLSSFMARSSVLLSMSVDKSVIGKASGIFAVIGNLGGFLSPAILLFLTNIFLDETTPYNQFVISFFGATILLIATIILTRKGVIEEH